eukprot:g6341.t1
MAGLSHAVMVQLGHSDDAVQMVLEKFGAHSVDMVFMDQRGTDPWLQEDIIDLREFGSAPVEDWMTVSWVRFGPSYGQLPQEVRQLNELARESDRFRLKAMATSMKDLVGDPLDDFAKKFTDEFIQLGIRTDNRYRSSPVRGAFPRAEFMFPMETVTPARKGLGASTSPQGEDVDDTFSSAQWTQSSDTPTEVYDIGHDSEDDVGPISSAVRSLNVDGALPPEPSWMPWTVERSPDSAVDGSTAPSSMSKAPTSRAKERSGLRCDLSRDFSTFWHLLLLAWHLSAPEADVWTLQDWDKQLQRLKEAPTPCRVPEGADAKQKQVADAVREELQVDLEALVNAAMDEMRSWVSQEIAFARSSFEEEAQKFFTRQEMDVSQDAGMQEQHMRERKEEGIPVRPTRDLRRVKREEVEPRTSCERVAEAIARDLDRNRRRTATRPFPDTTRRGCSEELRRAQLQPGRLAGAQSHNIPQLRGLSNDRAQRHRAVAAEALQPEPAVGATGDTAAGVNLHGSKVDPEDDLALWLLPQGKAADLYVIGIQELIELGPMSLLLNTDGHEERQAELEQRVEEILASSGRKFLKVCSFGMVGLSLLTFVSEHLEACIGEIDCDRVKTGIEGLGGNKGGLAVRFLCGMMSMNEHLQEVLTYAFQGISRNGSTRQPKKGFHRAGVYNALQHDLTVVFGDLNSRLDLPEGEAWNAHA